MSNSNSGSNGNSSNSSSSNSSTSNSSSSSSGSSSSSSGSSEQVKSVKEEAKRTFAELCSGIDPRLTSSSMHKHDGESIEIPCHLMCFKAPTDCDAQLKDDSKTWCIYCGQQVDADGATFRDEFHNDKHFPQMSARSTTGFIEWKGVFYFTTIVINKTGKSVSSLVCVSDVKPYGLCYLRQLHIDMWITRYGNIRPDNPLAPSEFDLLQLISILPDDNQPVIETDANGIKSFLLTQSLYKLAIEDAHVQAVLKAAGTHVTDQIAFQAAVNPVVNKKEKSKRRKQSEVNLKQRNISLSSLAGKIGNQFIQVPLMHLPITKLANELAKLLKWNLEFTSYTAMYHNDRLDFHADSPHIGEKFIIIKLSEDYIPVEFDPNHIKDEDLRGDKFVFVPKPWSLYVVEDHLRFAAHKVESKKYRAVLRLGYGNMSVSEWHNKTNCDGDCTCWYKKPKKK